MSYDARIEIHGTLSDPEMLDTVANAVVAEADMDRHRNYDVDVFFDDLRKAVAEGGPLVVERAGARDVFGDLVAVLVEADLSYVARYTERDGPFTHGFAWKPGMDNEREFLVEGEAIAPTHCDLAKAAKRGEVAVTALRAELAELVQPGVVSVAPGVEEAYAADYGRKGKAKAPDAPKGP